VGERETEREGWGGGEERGTYKLTRQNYDRCFFHPAITTEDGFFLFNNRTKRGENCTGSRSRFFSSIAEPDAVQTVERVAVA